MANLFVETLYGIQTRKGLLQVTLSDGESRSVALQCTPDEAREMARNLVDGAAIAETEEMLMRFLEESVGVDDIARRGQILHTFRTYRDKKDVPEVE